MFGANHYCAFQLELEYLKHHIVKPFNVSARKALQCIDVLLTYLPFFPPRTLRDKRPTEKEYKKFNAMSVATPEAKRDIQYAMLPINFRDSIDTWETDYETMNETIFLQRLEQVKKKDSRERKEREDNKEKLKCKSDANNQGEEHPNNNRKDKSDRDIKRNRRDGQKPTNTGKQRFCNMCKMSGAPSFVYKTHKDKECKKKDQYEKFLSGGAGKRYEAKKEYKSFESKMMKKMNIEFKKLQSKKKKRGSKKDDSEDDDMSVDSDGTNTSYWLNNITVHGGEDILSKGAVETDPEIIRNNKSKPKVNKHFGLNVLDQIVSYGNKNNSTLKNDVCGIEELTFNVKSPTPVTIGCIRHSNKNGRKVKYDNLKILLDSGCSHSILRKKYASNKLKDNKHIRNRRWRYENQMGIKELF